MLKKELAALLGVSESMVSRHAKKGMPTDSLERAKRWRKRHLEPGRVKGSRYDSKANQPAPTVKVLDLDECIGHLNNALQAGLVPHDSPVLLHTRLALRTMPDWRGAAETLEMPARVWVRLIGAVCSDEYVARARALRPSHNFTAEQLADTLHDGINAFKSEAAGWLLEAAWDLYELDGKSFQEDDDYNDE
jgi:hypothetical protein